MKKTAQSYEEWRQYQSEWFKTPRGRWHQHKSKAQRRGIAFLLTFEEWWDLWQASGKWEERGRRKDQYVMARFGDQGAYEIGNVKICLVAENVAESNRDVDHPPERRSAAMKAWWSTVTPEQRNAMAQAHSAALPAHSKRTRAKMARSATGRRMIIRDGVRCWAYPDDKDYPD